MHLAHLLVHPDFVKHYEIMSKIQELTCLMYNNIKELDDVDKVPFQMLYKIYASKRSNEQFIKKVEGLGLSLIPP